MGKKESLNKQKQATPKKSRIVYREKRGMYSSLGTVAIILLFFYIVTGIEDPIDVYDGFLNLIQVYSKSASWVQEMFVVLIDNPRDLGRHMRAAVEGEFFDDKLAVALDSWVVKWILNIFGGKS